MPKELIQLTPGQEKIVLEAFDKSKNPPSITDLIKLAFPTIKPADIDGRSVYGRAIKELLATKSLAAKTKTVYTPMERPPLSEEEKEFIKNNRTSMSSVEMAKHIYSNPNLTPLNIESRAVQEYVNTLTPEPRQVGEAIPVEEYRSPRTVNGVLLKIDKYVFGHNINKEHITAQQQTCLESLLSYINTFRFIHQIGLYTTQVDRDLFESSFIRYTYDKNDLTEEEVDQFISISHDNVCLAMTQRRIDHLTNLLDNIDEDNAQRIKITMELTASISSLNEEYNVTAKRQQNLLGDLKQKRSARLDALRSGSGSILNLVQMWKEEESRKKLLHLADARKALLEKTLNEFSGMEEVKARLFGVDPNETLNG